jgi:spore maturation protein CgeB
MRILALIPPYTPLRPRFLHMIRGMELAGHLVIREQLDAYVRLQQTVAKAHQNRPSPEARDHGIAYAQYLTHTVRRHQIQLIVGMWAEPLLTLPERAVGDRFALFNELLGVPFLHYWASSPDRIYPETVLRSIVRRRMTGRYHFHLTHNQSDIPAFRSGLGFSQIIVVPPAVDEATFRPWRPASNNEREFDLAINCSRDDTRPTPFMLEQLERDEPSTEGIRRDQLNTVRSDLVKLLNALSSVSTDLGQELADALIDEQLRDAQRSLDEKMTAAIENRLAHAKPATDGLVQDIAARGRINRLLQTSEMWRRPFYAAYLSRRFKCLLMGDSEFEGWDVRGERLGYVAHYELARNYSRAVAGLNVSRQFDAEGVNSKAFEIAASGTVLLQRYRKGFEQLYQDGKECLVFRQPAEAAEKLQQLLDDSDLRQQLATSGVDRTMAQHRWMSRMNRLLDSLEHRVLEVMENAPVPFAVTPANKAEEPESEEADSDAK